MAVLHWSDWVANLVPHLLKLPAHCSTIRPQSACVREMLVLRSKCVREIAFLGFFLGFLRPCVRQSDLARGLLAATLLRIFCFVCSENAVLGVKLKKLSSIFRLERVTYLLES